MSDSKSLATRIGQVRGAVSLIARAIDGEVDDALMLVHDELERIEEIADEMEREQQLRAMSE